MPPGTSERTVEILKEIREEIAGIKDPLDGKNRGLGGPELSIIRRLDAPDSTIEQRFAAIECILREMLEQERFLARYYARLYFAG